MILFVTGATSGFGEAIAEIFARNGWNIIITGRRSSRLNDLSIRLQNEFDIKVLPLEFDVRDMKAVNAAISTLPEEWKAIDVLVNNAGLALGLSDLQEGNTEDWDTMIDTNIKGLLYVTRAIAPLMTIQNHGHIINISSIAGKEVYPKGNVYSATKHAVDALSKAMRIDMLLYHIKVTSINPGMAETEFSLVRYKGDNEKAASVYKGMTPLYAGDVAEVVYFAATRPKHVNLDEIIIMPADQATARDVLRTS
jgi:NADP-dependent 3-hydroxy acid dehydrogenase YdfG